MKRALVTDTSSSITPKMAEELGIHLIPLDIIFGGQSYKDGYDLSLEEFYQKMAESENIPTTSQPAIGEFIKLYESLIKDYDEILSILPRGSFSGTVRTAQMAAEQVAPSKITVVDSEVVSVLSGYQVLEAKRLMDLGEPTDKVIERLEDMKTKTTAFFMLDDFTNLIKSGRIPSLAGKLIVFSKIKPIVKLSDKGIAILKKVRTSERALKKMEETAYDYIDSLDYPVRIDIAHGNIPETAEDFRKRLVKRYSDQKSKLLRLAGVIGVHSGPRVVGITITPDYSKM